MAKLISLDINYDPDYPFNYPVPPEPRRPRFFPYNGGTVSILGLKFTHRSRHSGGPDPYAGEGWTLELGSSRGPRSPWLTISLSNLVCDECEVELRPARLIDSLYVKTGFPWWWARRTYGRSKPSATWSWRWCEVSFRKMPATYRWFWHLLERRRQWWEYNTADDYCGDYWE